MKVSRLVPQCLLSLYFLYFYLSLAINVCIHYLFYYVVNVLKNMALFYTSKVYNIVIAQELSAHLAQWYLQ